MRGQTKQMLTRLGRSLAFRALLVVLALYAVYHLVAAFSDRVVTDVIVEGEASDTVCGEAIIFRDETVLSTVGTYLCSYPLANGAKVGVSSSLASLYPASGDAALVAERQIMLSLLDRQIARVMALPTGDSLASLPSLQKQTNDALIAVRQSIDDGAPMSRISDGAMDALLSLNRIGALTGQSTEDTLERLRAQRQDLLGGYAVRTMTVADVAADLTGGYFYHGSEVDGYEEIFRHEQTATMELADFDALVSHARREYGAGVTVVGKLAHSFRWSVAVELLPDVAERLKVGKHYAVVFTDEYDVTVDMELTRLIGSRAEGRMVAILTASVLPEHFSFTRFCNVEIVLDTVYGYRVPESALVELDGVTGVYILRDGRVSFRAVETAMAGDGYILAYAPTRAQREDEEDETYHADRYVALRDIVITKGEDLYDGKYID